MYNSPPRPLHSLFGLTLALLLVFFGGVVQSATAQQTAFDTDNPVTSLRQAPVASDADLVNLATALMKARADTKISHATYRKGVRYFMENHPEFYGAFFGDPFYATYDARYFNIAWARRFAEVDINPQNGIGNLTSFFCHPVGYDPALGGTCRTYSFAASDFFVLPIFVDRTRRRVASLWDVRPLDRERAGVSYTQRRPRASSDDQPRQIPLPPLRDPDTSQVASARVVNPNGGQESRASDLSIPDAEDLEGSPDRIEVPDDASVSMQDRARKFKRMEITLRLQQYIDVVHNGDARLSPRERYELATQLAGGISSQSSDDKLLSRVRRLSNERDRRIRPEDLGEENVEIGERRRLDARDISVEKRTSDSSSEPRAESSSRENSHPRPARTGRSSSDSESSDESQGVEGGGGNS